MELETAGGGRGAKRRRVDEQGGQGKEIAAKRVSPAGHISALPDEVRQRILTRLPLKDAIRTAALDQGWCDLWKSRWAHPTSCRDIHLRPGDAPGKVVASLEREPRRRLDRLTLVVDNQKLRPPHLKRLLMYAVDSRVGDLRVDLRDVKDSPKFNFNYHFPMYSPFLSHLSLRNIKIWDLGHKRAQPFYALEVLRLHSVEMAVYFHKVILALCPRLHTLDLRNCVCDIIFTRLYDNDARAFIRPSGASLSRITVVDCGGSARLDQVDMPRLHSFRYSGRFRASPFYLPKDAALTDLYIMVYGSDVPAYFSRSIPDDLSGLTTLTISSNVLKNAGPAPWFKLVTLQSLRELQLIMVGMQTHNLADIYEFFKAYHCYSLERLFVQLPTFSDVSLEDLHHDVCVESPRDSLRNLNMVKVVNFNWRRFEVQLVSFLLRSAASLHKVLLVSPNITPLNVPGVQEADLSLLKEALANGHIIINKFDSAATQPFHSEILSNVSFMSSVDL